VIAATVPVLLTTFCVSVVVVGIMHRYALQRGMVDRPNMRSSHTLPTPRGGGVAIVISFMAALLTLFCFKLVDARTTLALVAGGCAIAGIGFLDDQRQLPAKLRLAVHIATASYVVVLLGGLPEHALVGAGVAELCIGYAVAVLAFVWGTNLFNFMDGIDGIAGSEAIFVSSVGAWLNWLNGGDPGMTAAMLCLSVSTLGFLVWNWPPARIFMGDVGSGFLGFTLATLALATSQRGNVPLEVWPILGGVFLVDSTTTLIRRVLRGDRWMEPHRMHAYQHLARRWRAHRPVTMSVIAIDIFWLFPWAWFAAKVPGSAPWCLAAAIVPLVGIVLASGAGAKED
jgi:Fuc2NAc and GlcNAc transferase